MKLSPIPLASLFAACLAGSVARAPSAHAQRSAAPPSQTYSLKNVPSKLIVIQFESQMEIEDILGTSNAAQGELTLAAGTADVAIAVPVASLRTGIDLRDEHLRSDAWLDAKAFPLIQFAAKQVAISGKSSDVRGNLTLHGVTKPITAKVELRQIAAPDAKALGLGDGAWVRVRGSFSVKLSDFGIKIPPVTAAKVNDTWNVKVSFFAQGVAP